MHNIYNMTTILSLVFLEIILSIDNLIFISALVSGLHGIYKEIAKFIGLSVALIARIILLFGLNHLIVLDKVFYVIDFIHMEITYKELIFIIGGIFLIYKGLGEVIAIAKNEDLGAEQLQLDKENSKLKNFFLVIFKIIMIDFLFSLDSIMVAVALTPSLGIIIAATLISMITLCVSTNVLSKVLVKFPSIKLLAMCFIVMLGLVFVLDGFEIHIDKSYMHSALLFAVIFEIFDIIRIKNLDIKKL